MYIPINCNPNNTRARIKFGIIEVVNKKFIIFLLINTPFIVFVIPMSSITIMDDEIVSK